MGKLHEGKFQCGACIERANPTPRCFTCGEKISGAFLKFGDRHYHTDCLKCDLCSGDIPSSKVQRDSEGRMVCDGCLPKCAGCGETLSGETCTLGDGKSYHKECFACSRCKTQLGG